MPQASKTDINEIDQSFSPAAPTLGISAVFGKFKRGPINDPSTIISAWPQFKKIFGDIQPDSDDAILAKRALERGSQFRVVNLRHYTDITNPATLSAVVSTPATGKTVSLASVLITANIETITVNGTPIAQLFATSSDATQTLLAQKIAQTLPGIVSQAVYLGGNKILITPTTGTVLVVTAVVTLGASQAATTIASVNSFNNAGGNTLFSVVPKYAGSDYNNLSIAVQNASNGVAGAFDLVITHAIEADLNEKWPNNKIVGAPTVAASNYLQQVVNGSQLVNIIYNDLSAVAANPRPVNTIIKYDTGTDGGAVVDTDLIGDSSANTGVYALDPYDDFIVFGSLNSNSLAVMQAFAAYATNRGDCVAVLHVDNSYVTEAQVTALRDSTLIDSTYVGFYTGGVAITDPFTLQKRNISELGDVIGIAAYSFIKFGPWYSFAGPRRGVILNALGVVNNFGLASNYAGRNLLANHQVNCVITKDGKNQLSGNFTGQLDQSTLSYMNVRTMLIYLKKILAPIFDRYIEEPDDPTTWKAIYNEVKPQLEILRKARGIKTWDYQGDQFVSTTNDCVINQQSDLDQGKYKVILYITNIVSLQLITVDITLTDSGVSFEDSLSQVGATNQ